MKSFLSLTIVLLCYFSIAAQDTYSKYIRFESGVPRHLPYFFTFENDNLIVPLHLDECPDAFPCTAMLELSKEGEVLRRENHLFWTQQVEHKMVKRNEEYYLFGHDYPITKQPSIVVLDADFQELRRQELEFPAHLFASYYQWNGIKMHDDALYTFGWFRQLSPLQLVGVIGKYDAETFDLIDLFIIDTYNKENKVHDLHITDNGNLVFLNYGYDDEEIPRRVYDVLTLSFDGQIISNKVFETYSKAMLTDDSFVRSSDGSFLYSSRDISGFSLNSHINKIDPQTGEHIWDVGMPYDTNELGGPQHEPIWEYRKYELYDISQTQNGDYLVCGMIYDLAESAHLGGPYDNTDVDNDLVPRYDSGFITRISGDGEVLWHKIYIKPDDSEQGYIGDEALQSSSVLTQVAEDSEGYIYAVGQRELFIEEPTPTWTHDFWLLRVDANGCIDGYDCIEGEEELVFTGVDDVIRLDEHPDIGIHPNPVGAQLYIQTDLQLKSYQVYDATGRLVAKDVFQENIVPTEALAKGTYTILLITKSNKLISGKFIKS